MSNPITRRELLKASLLTPLAATAAVIPTGAVSDAGKRLRGVFIILNTPFTSTGEVDWTDLEREVDFVRRGGCSGIVWPQGSSGVATLTREERLHGMEVLAKATKGTPLTLVLGVQGKDTAEMLAFTRRAADLGSDAVIAMPPTTGTSMDDYRSYFRALGGAFQRPIFMQTSGGAKNLFPSVELMVELAREFPHMAYVKEESEPVVARMQQELAARPVMKGIFGASLGTGFLYEMRLGLDGIITGMGMYADLFGTMWRLHEQGRANEVRDMYARFLLMRNLNESIPGTDLHVMTMRGVFKIAARRIAAPQVGQPIKVTEFRPTPTELAEITFRYEALKGYLSLLNR